MASLFPALILCLAAVLSFVDASDLPVPQRATHQIRTLPNGLGIKTYHPESKFEVYERAVKLSLSKRAGQHAYVDAGINWMKSQHGKEATLHSNFKWATSSHVYAKQHINGIPIANTHASISIDPAGNIVSSSSTFVQLDYNSVPSATPRVSAADAVRSASAALNGQPIGKDPELRYLAVDDSKVALTHAVRMWLDDSGEFVDAYVDASSGEVVGVVEYTSHATMRVVPFGQTDVSKGRELIVNPEDKLGSPYGWTSVDGQEANATVGNNVWAFKANVTKVINSAFSAVAVKDFLPELVDGCTNATSHATFDYNFNATADPRKKANIHAATVNAWHVANRAHDILYRYGFTEQAFNFQLDGDTNVGENRDPMWISVQDGHGKNNGVMHTFEDGLPGLMYLYLFTGFKNPALRDSAFDNSVILHEYAHGLSKRLTSGGSAKCLGSHPEAGGLGEGYSDTFANWVVQSSSGTRRVHDFKMGEYLTHSGDHGQRSFSYSVNRTVNPQTYKSIANLTEVHYIGEVWAQVMHIVHNVLVNTLGSAPAEDVFSHPEKENGHSAFLRLMLSALASQPCHPTFPQARSAWITADRLVYNSKNTCNLWLAFAYMGLGVGAKDHKDDFSVPAHCALRPTYFVAPPSDLE